MKKIILSAAVAAMAFSTSAMAADKGIDIDVSGQATVYYETHSDNRTAGDKGQFDQANSTAAAGIQLNLGSDLGNNFTFGSQITYLGSLGLEKDVVGGLKQSAGTGVQGSTTDDLALTKMFIAKKVANTTLKLGRQELPMSLSPLAFSEGWNVYKNTFDAIIAVNSDIPNTTLVGAYVSGGTQMSLGTTTNLVAVTTASGTAATVTGSAYMVTAATTAIPMTTLTLSFYDLENIGANLLGAGNDIGAKAYWADAQIAPTDAPAGLKVALQAGKISPENSAAATFDDTTALGAKVTAKIGAIGLKAIYTTVSDVATGQVGVAVQNTGTGIKSPLYSQMMYNQNMISMDADTIVLGASYDMGEMGSIAANYGMTEMGDDNRAGTMVAGSSTDYNELDLVYKVKAGGVQYFAIAAIRDIDAGGSMNTTTGAANAGATDDTVLRFWARYNF